MRRLPFLLLAGLVVLLPAADASAADTTGRLLVTLHGAAGPPGAQAAAATAVASRTSARRAGYSVSQIRLATLRHGPGDSHRVLEPRLRSHPHVQASKP